MSRGRLTLVLLAAAGAAIAILSGRAESTASDDATHPTRTPAEPATDARRSAVPVGNRSCSARACHGGIDPGHRQVQQREYTIWLTRDKHAEAYDTLVHNSLSQSIAQRLGTASGAVVPAFEDARCLACHANPALAKATAQDRALRREGVSCEACHGTGPWIDEHTNSRGWRSLSLAQKREQGLVTTIDLPSRARLCAECHVGAGEEPSPSRPFRDVNHDLIAAGHPRLAFELTAYLDMMPAHWNRSTHSEELGLQGRVRTWAVGQAEGAAAALRLLASRAQDKRRPWPEFAEYDCFSCHHDLKEPSWRQRSGPGTRRPGALPWAVWPTSMLPTLFAAQPIRRGDSSPEILSAIASIQQLMGEPDPDRSRAARRARGGIEALEEWIAALDKETFEPASVAKLLDSVVTADPTNQPSWARARQAYLAVAALYPALVKHDPKYRSRRVETYLESAPRSLPFPPGYESPRLFEPRPIESSTSAPPGSTPATRP